MAKMYEYVKFKMYNSLENFDRFNNRAMSIINLVIHIGQYTIDKHKHEIFRFGKNFNEYVFKEDMNKLFDWSGSIRIYSDHKLTEEELFEYFRTNEVKEQKQDG